MTEKTYPEGEMYPEEGRKVWLNMELRITRIRMGSRYVYIIIPVKLSRFPTAFLLAGKVCSGQGRLQFLPQNPYILAPRQQENTCIKDLCGEVSQKRFTIL